MRAISFLSGCAVLLSKVIPRILLAIIVVLGMVLLVVASAAGVGVIMRTSTDASGAQGNGGSVYPVVSADGRYVSFTSFASNLVIGDTNETWDFFVKDTQTGAIKRISTDSNGLQAYGDFSRPSISSDGRYVAFRSLAPNLVPGDSSPYDIFVKDSQTGVTTRVSTDSTGNQSNGNSNCPELSSDGRHVAFCSGASNLVAGDTNGSWDVFLKDIQTGETIRLSTDSTGLQGNSSSSESAFSPDGRYLAFSSEASNLVAGDTNGVRDVFVKDIQTGATTRVSTNSVGLQGNLASITADISADGRFVTFVSSATNLVAGDTNGFADVFVKDTLSGVTTRVSVTSAGVQANRPSSHPSISADGRFVTFDSDAMKLVPGDTNILMDVFVKDTQTGAITVISVNATGQQGNRHSGDASLSADGTYVAFTSSADNLVPADSNVNDDVFLAATSELSGCVQPFLAPRRDAVRWSSYADYTSHLLSVDFSIKNDGPGAAYQVKILGAVSDNGVTLSSSSFMNGFTVGVGGNTSGTLKYHIPAGVSLFSTTIYATGLDACGNTYAYPGPYLGT